MPFFQRHMGLHSTPATANLSVGQQQLAHLEQVCHIAAVLASNGRVRVCYKVCKSRNRTTKAPTFPLNQNITGGSCCLRGPDGCECHNRTVLLLFHDMLQTFRDFMVCENFQNMCVCTL